MKILHVIDYFQPELGYQETFLAKEQKKQGHAVAVICSERYAPILFKGRASVAVLGKRLQETGSFDFDGIQVHRLKTLFEINGRVWLQGLETKIREFNPDVIHVHGIVTFTAIRVACLKKGKTQFRLLYDDHMVACASRNPLKYLYPLFRGTFLKLIEQQADCLIGVTESTKEFMHVSYGFPLNKIKVIPLGVDHELFRFNPRQRQLCRGFLGLKDRDILIIYVGKLIPNKGPHVLLEAVCSLMSENENIFLLFLGGGQGEYVQQMRSRIEIQGVSSKILWLDAILNKDLPQYYCAADVGVWPKECSVSMLDAMACNLPVIGSNIPAVKERLSFNNGLIYDETKKEELTGKLRLLVNDKDLRAVLGANGRKVIEEQFNWQAINNNFLICYRN
ncbi:hypothetical protein A2291_03050 [candidate division WOR-1 bacterium RIFOXYB2_FULL_42_35]|uniref:Glycosyltransferase subfamily 4-like N-terminal domain-containing protein n=1 Tax=candidate division WOR-1 bacterium RIFOXYC2_FULL_41_25 TaxID=1802586 RepID=A0A1F4TQX8_UNCSA|nr:MAG: hypothetical protein A2247_01360 [candidate division WOR-1 bacterium RIFOXYA2_FULL_41_14]OGC25723.1 MAG: hypothetical protein A2291_03050 [candidate division WOR-1 bacterium RIFOXYB2_FULL_42_35]OGC35125.1 MAG: hypothetical protein A2462_06195 [candidate division WOR-1 bacterium RIFOXYC2_FULL_41_25]